MDVHEKHGKTIRLTLYVPEPLYHKILELKEKGYYKSINELVRELIRKALKEEGIEV